jgi:hypothetical protein
MKIEFTMSNDLAALIAAAAVLLTLLALLARKRGPDKRSCAASRDRAEGPRADSIAGKAKKTG